jgi:hypothetical protein
MSTYREIRQKAWKMMSHKWTFRLIAATVSLSVGAYVVNKLIQTALVRLGITTLAEYCVKCMQANKSGVSYALPTTDAYVWMIGGELLSFFIGAVFFGILSFGILRACLKAEANDTRRWFADAFSGFARPLELAWLFFCQLFAFAGCIFLGALACALWLVPVVWVAGALGESAGKGIEYLGYFVAYFIIMVFWIWALYRYRYAWYLKGLHPDWSAVACVVKGRRLIAGYKWKAVCLDFSFAGWCILAFASLVGLVILLVFVKSACAASVLASVVLPVLLFAVFFVVYYAIVRLSLVMVMARLLLLREILAEKGCD